MEKRYKLNVFLCLTGFMFLHNSCITNTIEYVVPEGIAGLNVPAGFDWSNLKEVDLTVKSDDKFDGRYYYTIEIYDGNPVIDSSAVILAKGVARKNSDFKVLLAVADAIDKVFIKQIDPQKVEVVQSLTLNDENLVFDFSPESDNVISNINNIPDIVEVKPFVLKETTPANAILLNANVSSAITLQPGLTYLIPNGITYTGKIRFSAGSILYVEGALNASSQSIFELSTSSKIVVQSNGSLNTVNAAINMWAGELHNYGLMLLGQTEISNSARIINYSGTLEIRSNLTTRNKENQVVNYANMSLQNVNLTNGEIDNKGYLTITGRTDANGAVISNTGTVLTSNITSVNSVFNANCNFEVLGNFTDLSGSIINIKEGSRFKSVGFDGSGTKVNLQTSAIWEAIDVTFSSNQSTVTAIGQSYSLARLVHVKPGNGRYQCVYYKGNLEIENTSHFKGTNKWNSFYLNDDEVRWSKTNASGTTIPSGSCNGGGNVVLPPDITPVDPVFPISVPQSTNYTLLFEDQWPAIGDYDLNDLVLGLSVGYLQNSANLITGITIETELRAVGARKRIAAAVQFDELLPTAISSVSYSDNSMILNKIFPLNLNGSESGQDKAVVPFFDDAHSVLIPEITQNTIKMINTYSNEPGVSAKKNLITINLSQPLEMSQVNVMKMNFFIVSNGNENSEKRTEVHLSGYTPTKKNDWTKLGRGYDNSINGVYYTTPGNMIWGLLVPFRFNYPLEQVNITEAYPQFSGWCTSGGLNFTNWYANPNETDGLIYK